MTLTNRFSRIIEVLGEYAGKAVSWFNLVVMIFISIEVVARYGFNSPTIWAWDMSIQLIAAVALFGAAYAFSQGTHVKVDVLSLRLSPRKRATLDMVTSSLFFICIGILVWKSWQQGLLAVRQQELMPGIWHPPLYPLKMAVPVAAFFLFLQGVVKFIRDLAIVSSKEGQP